MIGTGSSGIQSVPIIAEQAAHLHVFQRTAAFSFPAGNKPLDAKVVEGGKDTFADGRRRAINTPAGALFDIGFKSALEMTREEADEELERRWQQGGQHFLVAFRDVLTNKATNDILADFVRKKIREVVKDPQTAEMLIPKDYAIGTKRPCIDTNYFETFNRDNVTLVDIRANPIQRITETGIACETASYDLDIIVFATGFDAMTGSLSSIDIRGVGGLELREKWAAGPRTYLGLMVASFPNLFILSGPGSPSVLANGMVAGEQHAEWVTNCIMHLRENDIGIIDATVEAEDNWVNHVNEVANMTLYPSANSWYMGTNVPGKPQIFMPYIGGFDNYCRIVHDVATSGYRGFILSAMSAIDAGGARSGSTVNSSATF